VRGASTELGAMTVIHIDKIWPATDPLDVQAGPDTALARFVFAFGSAKPCTPEPREPKAKLANTQP